MFVYLENVKNRSVRFQVLSYDKEKKTGVLRGEYGAEFSRDMSKEALNANALRCLSFNTNEFG